MVKGHFPPGGFLVTPHTETRVDKIQDKALQAAKEIVVKFVETGRISPANFQDYFSRIYLEVLRTITENTPYPGQSHPDRDQD